MKIEFNYILKDHGWAIGKLKSKDFSTEFNASYLHDTLNSIINALIGLLTDRKRVMIPFYDEPGEHQLVIEKIDNTKKITIELKWYEDYATEYFIDSDKYELLYKGETTLKSFITNGFNSIEKILNENGIEGYKEKWRREFPIVDFKKLTELKSTNAQQWL
ncbi:MULTISPECIES: hypothetical protein [Aequorivita]|uniref:DUF4265 domain-containing protein n=1 Tax=Aequorivita iocasae TaxID=2803865 RepID=A0ABX7DP57_9FLAO|nr:MULTISPECIES: hypothetical protein [Aequorivita]QQX75610.1 hypothetical protein JK629_09660 [Aequorivita iocasae]UCA55064.1 hypothetical protein LDL78_09710 [Aequorivita sp. F7]